MRTLILVIKVSKHAHCTHCAVLVLADSEKLCMWLRSFKIRQRSLGTTHPQPQALTAREGRWPLFSLHLLQWNINFVEESIVLMHNVYVSPLTPWLYKDL